MEELSLLLSEYPPPWSRVGPKMVCRTGRTVFQIARINNPKTKIAAEALLASINQMAVMVDEKPPITEREAIVLRHIRDHIAKASKGPSHGSIMRAIKASSSRGVQALVAALEDKKLIVREPGVRHGIALTDLGKVCL